MYDVICMGELLIDFTPGREPGSYIRNPGGAPANVAVAAAKNGLRAAFLGKMGCDDFGSFLIQTLEAENVIPLCTELEASAITTLAFVTLAEDGNRSFTFARKPGADMFLTCADVKREYLESTAILHAGSFGLSKAPASEATVYALKTAHELGKLVSFDVNYRSVAWDGDINGAAKAVLEILPYVDILKVSDEEAVMFGGEEEVRALLGKYGLAAIVMTYGAEGAGCYFADKFIKAPSKKVHAVDTTGAGDAFWGNVLASLILDGVTSRRQLNEEILARALARGNSAGGLSVQKHGAIPSMPTKDQIEQNML